MTTITLLKRNIEITVDPSQITDEDAGALVDEIEQALLRFSRASRHSFVKFDVDSARITGLEI